ERGVHRPSFNPEPFFGVRRWSPLWLRHPIQSGDQRRTPKNASRVKRPLAYLHCVLTEFVGDRNRHGHTCHRSPRLGSIHGQTAAYPLGAAEPGWRAYSGWGDFGPPWTRALGRSLVVFPWWPGLSIALRARSSVPGGPGQG